MKHFLIYTNQMKDKEYQITGEVKRLLEEKGQQVTLFSELKSGEIPVHMDAMLVLGGMARCFRQSGKPKQNLFL